MALDIDYVDAWTASLKRRLFLHLYSQQVSHIDVSIFNHNYAPSDSTAKM